MPSILITRPIPAPGLELLRQSPHSVELFESDRPIPLEKLLAAVRGRDAILCQMVDRIDAQLLDAAGPSLKVVAINAVGYDNIDIPACHARGVVACNTPDVLTDATADTAWLLLMGVARRAAEGERIMRSGTPWGPMPTFLLGGDLVGRTLLIVGAGRIGRAVARRAQAWNMRILYASRRRDEEFERVCAAERMDLDAALPLADYVSLHVPLTPDTRRLIDARRLKLMKPTAYLINTARGAVVDETALVEALRSGTIAGAGLDVYENEPDTAPGLTDCTNTFLLPHIGSATKRTRDAMSLLAAQNILAVLDGREPPARIPDLAIL